MSDLYLRNLKLTVQGSAGTYDFSGLRVRFNVMQTMESMPNRAVISITNAKHSTAIALAKSKEYTKVTLEAGYRDLMGVIFKGDIQKCLIGRDNPTDTRLDIFATDGWEAHRYAVVNSSLASGYTSKDVLEECMKSFKPFGVVPGFIPNGLDKMRFPRGRVLQGPTTDIMAELEKNHGCKWSIQEGRLNFVANNGRVGNDTVVLNSQTGMIGRPTQDPDGIHVRTLLIPTMHVETVLKINEASINQAAPNLGVGGEALDALVPIIASDGLYRVLYVQRVGDTHGAEWYNDLTCLAFNNTGSVPANLVQFTAFSDQTTDGVPR